MWGSDFPHPRCTYPNSHRVIEANYARLGEDTMRKIALGNAARFYQIELPASLERVAAE
jgi:predicted TIM-barrel fold metal-dependent hydrolase